MPDENKTPSPYECRFNIWNYGKDDVRIEINPLHTLARLYSCFATLLNVMPERTAQDLQRLEPPSNETLTLCFNHAQSLLERQVTSALKENLDEELRHILVKLTYRVFQQTVKDKKRTLGLPKAGSLMEIVKTVLQPPKRYDRQRLGLPKLGRPAGRKTRKPLAKIQSKNKERKNRILTAIAELYGGEKNLEPYRKKAIAEKVGISTKTLNTWLREGHFILEKLLREGIKGK